MESVAYKQKILNENKHGGIKFDGDKLRYDLVPVEPIKAVADIVTYGAKKYKPNNWQKVEMWRYKSAFMRHWFAWLLGEDKDPESGRHHIDHALCNLFFIKWKLEHGDVE